MRNEGVPLAVDLQYIHKQFRGGVKAVDGVTLRVPQGQILALLGPNGAGKTTLLDIALGLQPSTSGSAHLLGLTPPDAVTRGMIGAVNQTGSLPLDLGVGELLQMFHGFYDQPLSVAHVSELAQLQSLLRRKVGKLSGGEQQRLRLALALLPDPLMLFLDEPTAGLDPAARQDFWRVMRGAAGTGRTIVFATHYLAEAEAFAERTVIMRAGRIVADGPTSELTGRGTGTLQIELPRSSYESLATRLEEAGFAAAWSDGQLTVHGPDLDDVARLVLAAPGARHLRVADASLEEVFTAIALEKPAGLEETSRAESNDPAAQTGAADQSTHLETAGSPR